MSDTCELFDLPQASRLARAIRELGALAPSRSAMSWAHASFVDAIAAILAGVAAPNIRALLSTSGLCSGAGDALVLGTGRRTSALDACFVNAVAFHARLTAEPSCSLRGGQWSGPLVSALLALGEERRTTGKQVLHAYWVGCELAALSGDDRARLHEKAPPTGDVVATLAVAGACAQLLGLDEQRTVTALVLAATLASGMHSPAMPLHLGQCARHGLLAAILAEHGFVPGSDAVDYGRDVLRAYEGVALSASDATVRQDVGSQDVAWENFCKCAAVSLPRSQIAPLFECLETLESANDLSRVTRLAEIHALQDLRVAHSAPLTSEEDAPPHDTTWVP
jgi:2-methylcitrate dehydratase PrpD